MISVCIATYNGEKYIKEQLDSILMQLNPNDEVIISDDASTDKTIEIIKVIGDSRIKIFHNQNIQGYTHNFENALNHASGDYIFTSDQDDVWLPEKVNTILPFLQKNNNLVISNAYIVNDNLEIQGQLSEWRKYKKGYWRNLYKNVYMGCTNAFTKEIKDYCLPFPAHIKGHDIWIGLLSELKFDTTYIEKPLILYRRHEQNASGVGTKSNKSVLFMFEYRFTLFIQTLKRFLSRRK